MAPRVLVVEDAPEFREFLTQSLLQEGFDVMTAEDGRQAMESISAHEPDAVVCDAVMPRQSGFALLKDLRAERKRLPVILTSTWDNEIARELARELGADAFVPKDTEPSVLVRALRSCLARTESSVPPLPRKRRDVIAQGRFTLGSNPSRALGEFCAQVAPILQALALDDRVRLAQGVTRAARVVMVCGNLELPPATLESEDLELRVRERLHSPPFQGRQVLGMAVLEADQLRVTLADQFEGLDYRPLHATTLAHVESCAVDVAYSDDGRKLELTYRIDPPLAIQQASRRSPASRRAVPE